MSTVPEPVHLNVPASATTFYTAFTNAASRAMLVSMTLTNTTSSDITVDIWYENSGATTLTYLAKTKTVPALGNMTWSGMDVIKSSSDKWRIQASATGVDLNAAISEVT